MAYADDGVCWYANVVATASVAAAAAVVAVGLNSFYISNFVCT